MKLKKDGTLSKQGEGGGVASKYDEKSLSEASFKYFTECDEKKRIPSKAGFRLSLDISRDTYNEYRKRFPDALKRVENAIEEAWVNRLSSNAPTGAIFYLKNAFSDDYRDKVENDIQSGGKPIPFLSLPLNRSDEKNVK